MGKHGDNTTSDTSCTGSLGHCTHHHAVHQQLDLLCTSHVPPPTHTHPPLSCSCATPVHQPPPPASSDAHPPCLKSKLTIMQSISSFISSVHAICLLVSFLASFVKSGSRAMAVAAAAADVAAARAFCFCLSLPLLLPQLRWFNSQQQELCKPHQYC